MNDATIYPSRRSFLKLAGITAAAAATSSLSLLHFNYSQASPEGLGARNPNKMGNWQDLYRQRWSWDRVAKGTHGWLNCRSACNFDLYIKDGIIVREEQTANYEASEPGVPDFNPRGCQKGACYTEVMYGPGRLQVPLKRVGERGEGKWEQISWDQAYKEIAEKMVDIIVEDSGDAIVYDLGPHFDHGPTSRGQGALFRMLGASLPDDWAEIGDLSVGATLSLGLPHVGGSSDEWFLSDYLVVWMMNPAVTQIPDAHFLFEAKYNGSELVVIDPQYSATAVHADKWLPIRPGTDAALALATAKHIWDTGRMNLPYVQEHTDLPLLVRLDTGRYLTGADLEDGGSTALVHVWDPERAEPVPAAGSPDNDDQPKLSIEELAPPIEGQFEIRLHDGTEVRVATVGSILREHLDPWTFENTAEVTDLAVEQIRQFAEGFSKAERPMVLSSWGSNRYFHSDQMNRAKILCLSLKGAIGKKGAGYHATGWIETGGFGGSGFLGTLGLISQLDMGKLFDLAIDKVRGRISAEKFKWEFGHEASKELACMTNSASMNLKYQGIRDDLDKEQEGLYPRPLTEYDREARERDWMPVFPREKIRAWVTGGNNVLRRSNLPQRTLEHMWPKLDLVIDINQKLTFTGMHADYLLPAAGYYEKHGIKYPVAYIPYLHFCDAAVPPIAETRDEWRISWDLAAEIQRIAIERDLPKLDGCGKFPVDLKTISDRYSHEGKYGPHDTKAVTQTFLDNSITTEGMTVDSLEKTGVAKFKAAGGPGAHDQCFNTDWKGEGVLDTLTHFTKYKWPWLTRTGRQQFYIDHPWFLEAGESLPTHIESPKAGGDYPFHLISCHARWSVHSIWRDDPMMLRLQRGEPALYLNPKDAERLEIGDGDWAVISNRLGEFFMRIKHSTMVRPSVAYYFHAWEPHQFPNHESYKFVTPGLMKPLHFAGGEEGQIRWRFAQWEPGTHVQDTRVAIRRRDEGAQDAISEAGEV